MRAASRSRRGSSAPGRSSTTRARTRVRGADVAQNGCDDTPTGDCARRRRPGRMRRSATHSLASFRSSAMRDAVAPGLLALADRWLADATTARRYGAENVAVTLERAAADLRDALQVAECELLTLTAAAAESGYSADYLGDLLRQRPELNAGRPHAPRIRRADLPRKAS